MPDPTPFVWWQDLAIPLALGFAGGSTSHLLGRKLWREQATRSETNAQKDRRRSAALEISRLSDLMDGVLTEPDDKEARPRLREHSLAIQTEALALEHPRVARAIQDAAWSAEHCWIARTQGDSPMQVARDSLADIRSVCSDVASGRHLDDIELPKGRRVTLESMYADYYGD